MATKKNTETEIEPVAEKETAAEYNPWERVEVFIPRGPKNGDPNFYVSVNDYRAVLPRGQKSLVPRFIAEEIDRSREAENIFADFVESKEIKEDNLALM